jgi:hypothetical protein
VNSVIGAVIFSAFILGCLLGASGKWHTPDEEAPYRNAEDDAASKVNDITRWRRYIHSYLTDYKRNRSESRHHRNPNIIWSRRTFWVVFFYTAVTFALLVVNWRIAGTAKDTEERQLRAYVFPDAVEISDVDSDTTKISSAAPRIHLVIKNTGITPAYNVINLVAAALVPFPFHLDIKDIRAATGMKENMSVFSLSNGGISEAFSGVDGAREPLNIEQKLSLSNGETAIYLLGYIWYYDIFGIVRCTRYKYYVGGIAGFSGARMRNATEGQDADKDCYQPTEIVEQPLVLPEVPRYEFR